jgi:hypothetical protein
MDRGGTSDPFVEVKLGGVAGGEPANAGTVVVGAAAGPAAMVVSKAQKKKTSVAKKTLSPVWGLEVEDGEEKGGSESPDHANANGDGGKKPEESEAATAGVVAARGASEAVRKANSSSSSSLAPAAVQSTGSTFEFEFVVPGWRSDRLPKPESAPVSEGETKKKKKEEEEVLVPQPVSVPLTFTVMDHDRFGSNDFMGQVCIDRPTD